MPVRPITAQTSEARRNRNCSAFSMRMHLKCSLAFSQQFCNTLTIRSPPPSASMDTIFAWLNLTLAQVLSEPRSSRHGWVLIDRNRMQSSVVLAWSREMRNMGRPMRDGYVGGGIAESKRQG